MKGLLNETDASLIADLKSVSREVNLFGTAHNPAVVEAFPKRWVQFDLDLNDSQIASYVDYEDCDHALINKSNSFVHVRGILSMKVDTLPYILAAEVGVLSP